MHTGRGFERLITFADAVVAIALTLLVLPLVEIPADIEGGDVAQLLREHGDELLSFLISFLVIWVLWRAHHATMEYFRRYDAALLRLTMVWLLTIVLLPFTTQLLNAGEDERGAVRLYIGVLLVSSLCLVGMSWLGTRRRHLLVEGPEVDRWVNEPVSLITAAILLIALVLSIVVPAVGPWPLLALIFDDTIEKGLLRLRRRAR
jgi:uncharacterized membrane protein